jgi:hypothetical protein
MSPEFIPAAVVRDLATRISAARESASASVPSDSHPAESAAYWERTFEANAAAVLATLGRVQLPPGYVVRYRFYGRHGGDLLVRPFVARASTDVDTIRQLIDWHPPPDSVAPSLRSQATRDVDFLYRHFTFERSPLGFFEYWLAMQELWASAAWIHSRIICEADAFSSFTQREGWRVDNTPERFEPVIVADDDGGAQAAVLLYCPLGRESITLQRIQIGSDQTIDLVEAIPVAHGPRGYRI